ncbi:MAG TPA: SCO family protein [Verrucomicrobiae bacterium]|jgi:protein SCO1/2
MKYLMGICGLLLAALLVYSTFAAPDKAAGSTAKMFSARGIVQQIAADRQQATIKHEAIPGYMMAMTMDFPVKDTNELNRIAPGDEITFKLVVNETNDWIERIQFVSHHIGAVTNKTVVIPTADFDLKPGDLLPDGELTSETGQVVHFSDYRGKVLAFTFFFTRCPLPDFCPLMDRNFSNARQLLLNNPYAPTNWQFLSISFDPAFDTPEALANYARLYRNDDAGHWLFAAASTNVLANIAPRLDLVVMHEGLSISHNLRTVVLDPQGRIAKQFDGNKWTPQQLADAMREAAGKK